MWGVVVEFAGNPRLVPSGNSGEFQYDGLAFPLAGELHCHAEVAMLVRHGVDGIRASLVAWTLAYRERPSLSFDEPLL